MLEKWPLICGINPNTVKKAYDELERRNVITTLSTKGTFIADDTKSLVELKIVEKLDIIKAEILELQKLGISKDDIFKNLMK